MNDTGIGAVTLPKQENERARQAVRDLREELGIDAALQTYRPHLWSTLHKDFPVLHLEDVTGIPFLQDIAGITQYQHRARVRASQGDLFAASSEPVIGYEEYCQQHLGLGAPEFLRVEPVANPMAIAQACARGTTLDTLAARARAAGGLVVHPYMSIDDVWTLAKTIATAAGVPVSVVGPPPPVLWLANDKSLLSEVVNRVLGQDWLVETQRATNPESITAHILAFAARHPWVGLKRTRCASAMGNIVFESATLLARPRSEVEALVRAFLHRTEWCDGEEVLVVEWAITDLSPSTQLWLPPLGDGPPLLEGVYEQLLTGPEKIFVGSRPSLLPAAVNAQLAHGSLELAAALQQLGYVGRCSFDFIVLGDVHGDFSIRFTECNGRWGGTSTPMHLVDRLVKGPRPAYIAKDFFLPQSHVGISFVEFIKALGDELYDPKTGQGRFIFYNVGPVQEIGKLDLIALGKTPQDAQEGIDVVLGQRLGY
ncbi:MAG: hypothetical protein H0U74_07125 [Bradymonadaceae bacterium]|nr:hypothetical protein [Lujinxingiaceae bacterium]